jgi:hypothetical protein
MWLEVESARSVEWPEGKVSQCQWLGRIQATLV